MIIQLLQSKNPVTIAHRGYSIKFPENTMESFREAMRLNADILETDLVLSKDNELIISHDLDLDLLTNGSGEIRNYTVSELKEFDAGYYFTSDGINYPYRGLGLTIPTVRELFDEFGTSTYYNIDLKDPNPVIVDKFLQLVEEYELEDYIIMGSFHKEHIYRVREENPRIVTGSSYEETRNIVLASKLHLDRFVLQEPSFDVIQIPVKRGRIGVLNERFLQVMHSKGVYVHIWTINDSVEMKELLDMGVDGIFTDDIQTLNDVVKSNKTNSGKNFHILTNP